MRNRSPLRRSLPLALGILACPTAPASVHGQEAVWTSHPTWPRSVRGVVDPLRSRVIALAPPLTWVYSPIDRRWSVLPTLGTPPARVDHVVHDRLRDRCLAVTQDPTGTTLYSLNLADPPSWQVLHHTTAFLGNGARRALMHDSVRDRLLYWGGREQFTGIYLYFSTQMKQFDLVSMGPWLDLGPVAHNELEPALALDEPARQVWAFGGVTQAFPHDEFPGGVYYNDALLHVNVDANPVTAEWTARTTPRPTGRSMAHLIVDRIRNRILMMGGLPTDSIVWQFDLSAGTWGQAAPPNELSLGVIVPDPTGDRLLAFGRPEHSGTFDLSTDQWSPPLAPAPRAFPAIVHDTSRDRILACSGTGRDDLWALSPATMQWTFLQTGAPPGRLSGASAIYDPLADRMLLFGGEIAGVPSSDVWQLSLAGMVWSRVEVAGPGPDARSVASAAYDPLRHRMILSGGRGNAGNLADTWQLTLGDVPAWSRLGDGDGPPPHSNGSMVYVGHRDAMLLVLADGTTWTMPLHAGGPWTSLPAAGNPGRGGQAVWDYYRRSAVVLLSDSRVFRLTIDGTGQWSPVASTGTTPQIAGESRVLFDPIRPAMIAWGRDGLLRLEWPDVPTDIDVTLVSAVAVGSGVRLHWRMQPTVAATIERSDAGMPWLAIGHGLSDGLGDLRFDDDDAPAGTALAYRLRIGADSFAGEVEVSTPANVLQFLAAVPVPASRAAVALTLPTRVTGEIELVDVVGRRLDRIPVDGLLPGTHRIEFPELRPGLYFARLRTPEVLRTVRLAVTR